MKTAYLGGRVLGFSFSSPFKAVFFIREAITHMPNWRGKLQERKIARIFALFLTVANITPPLPSRATRLKTYIFCFS